LGKPRVQEVLKTLPGCSQTGFYEDRISLLRGLVIFRGGDFAFTRYGRYDDEQRYDDALGLLTRSLVQNGQNTIAWYVIAYIYHEKAMMVTRQMNSSLEGNNKEPVHRRWSPQTIEDTKIKANRRSLIYLNASIGTYSVLIANNAFDVEAYTRRARTFYAAYSKYEQNTEFLKSAIKDYSCAIDLDPLSYEWFYERGMIYSYMGESERSEADLKKSAELKASR